MKAEREKKKKTDLMISCPRFLKLSAVLGIK